jgi:hypothetical protein
MIDVPPATARWRKSTHSNDYGACVEVTAWRKSSHSNDTGLCVEVAAWRTQAHHQPSPIPVIMHSFDERLHDHEVGGGGVDSTVIAVRDSKDPDGPMLTFSALAWQSFLATLG